MTNEQKPTFKIAVGAVVVAIVVAFGFLVVNLVSHALNHTTVTPVSTSVISVAPHGVSEVTVTASVTSRSNIPATVSCLVGIERPAQPLAFPIRRTVSLQPGQTITLVVSRQLIKPEAQHVTTTDVAFVCT